MNAPRVRPRNLCYLEIPAVDMHESAQFCECVFAWNIRFRETERPRFDDTNGDVSGAWVTGRVSSRQPGILPYVMVADATAVAKKIVDAKGSIVPPAGPYGTEVLATFLDPAGNPFGVYEESRLGGERDA
jgi:hypothetical protein